MNSVNCPEYPRGEPGAGRLNLSVSLRSEVQLGVPCLCFGGSSPQSSRVQHQHWRDHGEPPSSPSAPTLLPRGESGLAPGEGNAWPQCPLLSRLGTASPVTAPGPTHRWPLAEGAGAKTPAHGQQRPTRLHTQHGWQWGREGQLLGAGLQRRCPPRPVLLSSDSHTWTPLQGPGHLEDVTQRRGPPSEAGCTPAGRGGPLLTQSPAPPLRSLSLSDCLPWSGPQHTETHLLLPHLLSQDPPREEPPRLHPPAHLSSPWPPPPCTAL